MTLSVVSCGLLKVPGMKSSHGKMIWKSYPTKLQVLEAFSNALYFSGKVKFCN